MVTVLIQSHIYFVCGCTTKGKKTEAVGGHCGHSARSNVLNHSKKKKKEEKEELDR
jgi:hypothetical protein